MLQRHRGEATGPGSREELSRDIAPPDTPSPDAPDQPNTPKRPFLARLIVIIIGTLLLACALFYGLERLVQNSAHEATDDAFLEAHVVAIAPKVAGIARKVYVVENQAVTNGQLLVEIDARDFEARAAQKRAAVQSAEANRKTYLASFELMRTRVETARATARQSQAEAQASQATAERSETDFRRVEELRRNNVASASEYDVARSTAQNAVASATASREKAAADTSRVTEAEAQLEAARNLLATASAQKTSSEAEQQTAELELSYTRLFAPTAGRITRKAVEPGSYLQVGQRVCAIVPQEVWVLANFKETQLDRMRVGQRAMIRIDAFPDREYRGHVESVQAGSGARFSLLPPENAVGNYVKVVQRVPVKIVFDEPLNTPHPAGPGMSAVPTVQVKDRVMAAPLVMLLAAAIAGVVGLLWWLLARRKTRAAAA